MDEFNKSNQFPPRYSRLNCDDVELWATFSTRLPSIEERVELMDMIRILATICLSPLLLEEELNWDEKRSGVGALTKYQLGNPLPNQALIWKRSIGEVNLSRKHALHITPKLVLNASWSGPILCKGIDSNKKSKINEFQAISNSFEILQTGIPWISSRS